MMTITLPEGSYLASLYQDKRRNFETRRVYYEDGRVEAFDGKEWWTVCRFSNDQVTQAKTLAVELTKAQDLRSEGIYDTASLTYAWRVNDTTGQVTNWAYPAKRHPIIKALETSLNELEAQARTV